MIIAELYGKIPSKLENKEDILTSNVFSFFKYSDRNILKEYLCQIGIEVSEKDTLESEFLFWQKYDDGTEPDLIVICGKYYILFEAKFYSDFSPKTSTIESQIVREIKMGNQSAKNEDKEFVYVAITAEYYQDKNKYSKYENGDFKFIWTNWQTITNFLETILTSQSFFQYKEYANDLLSLLVKKNLRSYIGIINLSVEEKINFHNFVFYNKNTSEFKGEFSGFIESLGQFAQIGNYKKSFHNSYFNHLQAFTIHSYENIFYNGN
ncbi:MAG: hypothetical protein LBH91_07335 [Prevotellaceae bacterium]|jgi:hypothetical protein|nr:hypothetical protein [Prevotellaceae bacterium]